MRKPRVSKLEAGYTAVTRALPANRPVARRRLAAIKDSIEIVDRVFESIKVALEKGESVKIAGFGKFEVKQKRSRRGRNPQTGEEIEITARKVLKFRPSQILRDAMVDFLE